MKFIYFIKPKGMLGPIKIGCTRMLNERLSQLSAWSPFPLEVIYSEQGDGSLERQLHRCFADYHSHLEWFHPGARLLAAIEKMKSGATISESVDLTDVRGSIFMSNGRKHDGQRPFVDGEAA
ncbi:MAG: GIY-YIG nuclease family protein [Agrobacterium cavarae]|uniref:GIY-YIG nuclease family protein n=1 Tax=Agrobacterium cavarae TaxID=2528239 RepID=UPI0031A5B4AD